MGSGGQEARKVRQSRRGSAEGSRDTAGSGKDSRWSGAVAAAFPGRVRGCDCRRKDQDLRPGSGEAAG